MHGDYSSQMADIIDMGDSNRVCNDTGGNKTEYSIDEYPAVRQIRLFPDTL